MKVSLSRPVVEIYLASRCKKRRLFTAAQLAGKQSAYKTLQAASIPSKLVPTTVKTVPVADLPGTLYSGLDLKIPQ